MATILTLPKLAKILEISESLAGTWHPHIEATLEKFDIKSRLRISAWIAQVGHESGRLSTVEENLNYSAEGLVKTFPKYFNSDLANQYARNPEAIASRVYGNRMGNGNEGSKEGHKYRGRGLIQITGKENYIACSKGCDTNLRDNPDLLKDKPLAAMSAGWFWQSKGLNAYADRSEFDTTTKRINGGLNGKADRDAIYQRALRILADEEPGGEPITPEPDVTTSISKEPTPIAKKTSIQEPAYTGGKSSYPHNRVYESPSGHVVEIDDTPGNERIHIYHRAGTYIQIDPVGSITIKSILDHTEITKGDKAQQTEGDETIAITGQSYKNVQGDIVEKSGSTITLEAPDKVQVNAPLLTFDEEINGPTAQFEQVTTGTLETGTATATTVTAGVVVCGALFFGAAGVGGSMGDAMDLSGPKIEMKKPVNNQKAVTTTEPTKLGNVTIQGFIDTDNSGAIVLCYWDTANTPNKWKRIKDDSVFTPKTDGSSGNVGEQGVGG